MMLDVEKEMCCLVWRRNRWQRSSTYGLHKSLEKRIDTAELMWLWRWRERKWSYRRDGGVVRSHGVHRLSRCHSCRRAARCLLPPVEPRFWDEVRAAVPSMMAPTPGNAIPRSAEVEVRLSDALTDIFPEAYVTMTMIRQASTPRFLAKGATPKVLLLSRDLPRRYLQKAPFHHPDKDLRHKDKGL